MNRRIKKRRSLRGKLLLGILYLFLCSLIIVAMRPIVLKVSSVKSNEDIQGEKKINNVVYTKSVGNKIEKNRVSYEREQYLVSTLLSVVGKVPYVERGTWEITDKGELLTEGYDTYGLVELAYYIANNNHLENAGVVQDNISDCKEVSRDELRIGDIGISILPGGNIYGVYVGNYGSYPLFIYACCLPNKNYEEGSVYISYDKNVCNDLFAGMYPVSYDMYVRLPGMDYKSEIGIDIADLLPEEVIPPQYYNDYASAIYRIGEWLRTNDATNLINRMNTSALERKGLYLDEDIFMEYVNSYNTNLGYDNYIFLLDGFTRFDDYIIVSSEIVAINESNKIFERTGIYFNSTIYDDGSYLPAPEVSLDKYAHLYGFRPVNRLETYELIEAGEVEDESISTYEEYGFIVDHSSLFNDD